MFRITILVSIMLMPMVGVIAPNIPVPILFLLGCFCALSVAIMILQNKPQG